MSNSLWCFSIRSVRLLLSRACVAAIFFILGGQLSNCFGAPVAIGAVAIAAIALCGSVALGFRWIRPGQITIVNRLAPIVLPLGMNVGRGRMRPILICSWAGWTIIGSIAAIKTATGFRIFHAGATAGSPLLRSGLVAVLVVDGIGIFYLAKQAAKNLSLRSPGLRSTVILVSILIATMIGSTVLWNLSWPVLGLSIAAAPPTLVIGFYSIFLLVTYQARWN